jgi:hypothetical protein
MATPTDHAQRVELFQAWLRVMGVDHAPELDLGTLTAIAEFLEAGRAPCATDAASFDRASIDTGDET